MSTLDIRVDIEISVICTALNSTIFFIFIMGMYTIIYAGTIYMHFRKNPSKYYPIPLAITMLYLSSLAQTALQWYMTTWIFIDNRDTRQSVFLDVFQNPQWLHISFNVFNCITLAIADGLLIWRCFYVWNRSLRIISLSLLLLIAEIALYSVEMSIDARYYSINVSQTIEIVTEQVEASASFMSFSTTLVTTFLIAYKIHSVSKNQGASTRFKHVVDIVVQSGVVYALSQLIFAISDVIPGAANILDTRVDAFQMYGGALNSALTGILPTIMVARVALLAADTTYPSSSLHLSRLQFPAHSIYPTGDMERVEITHSVDGSGNSDREGQENEGQAQ